MNIQNLKKIAALVLTFLTVTSSVHAYSWNGGFDAGTVYNACDGVGVNVYFGYDVPCSGNYNVKIIMQHSLSTTGTFTTVATQTKVSTLSSSGSDMMYFPSTVMNKSGYYRIIVSGTPAVGNTCGVTTINSYTSGPSFLFTITPTPVPDFNFNGVPGAFNVVACEPIKVNYTGTGTVGSYIYNYKEVTSTGATVPGGVSYTSPVISGAPTTFYVSLPTSKYFDVTIQVGNGSCTRSKTSRIYTITTGPTPTAAFKVNGLTLSSDCNIHTELYNCPTSNLTLSNHSIDAKYYRLTIKHHPTLKCNTVSSPFNNVYSADNLTTLPTDLNNLPGAITFIKNNPGYYQISLSAYSACGINVAGATGYMHITASPVGNAAFVTRTTTRSSGTPFSYSGCGPIPASTQVSYIPGGTTSCGSGGVYTFPMESSNVANANPVGKTTAVFDLSGVTTGTSNPSYTVTIKSDIWNAGSWINMNYLNTPEVLFNPTTIALTSLLEPGGADPSYIYADYFSNVTDGQIFRITVTVNNECGSKSQSQIIKLNTTSLRMAEATGETHSASATHSLNVFPNPATSEVNFEVQAADKDKVNIAVYDLKGAHVMNIVTNAEAMEGMNMYRGDLNQLNSGMYLYEVKVNNAVYKGKLSKQ